MLSELGDNRFTPIFLRFGTVYGFSGRTRFDLVVNLLTANAYTKKKMKTIINLFLTQLTSSGIQRTNLSIANIPSQGEL